MVSRHYFPSTDRQPYLSELLFVLGGKQKVNFPPGGKINGLLGNLSGHARSVDVPRSGVYEERVNVSKKVSLLSSLLYLFPSYLVSRSGLCARMGVRF